METANGSSENPMVGYRLWRGLPLSRLPYINSDEKLNQFDSLEIRDDDILIYTYPKSGSHFMGGIIQDILEIYSKRGPAEHDILPIEIGPNQDKLYAVPRDKRRVLMTHLPWDLLQPALREGNHKIFHVMRNPKDVTCSFFSFMKKIKVLEEDVTMDQFVDYFLNNKLLYGDYFKWLKIWYPVRKDPRMRNFHYEDMIKDTVTTIRMVADHLGYAVTDEQAFSIAEKNSFNNKLKERSAGEGAMFMRKGKAGGWKEELTVEQVAKLDEWIAEGVVGMDGIDLKC